MIEFYIICFGIFICIKNFFDLVNNKFTIDKINQKYREYKESKKLSSDIFSIFVLFFYVFMLMFCFHPNLLIQLSSIIYIIIIIDFMRGFKTNYFVENCELDVEIVSVMSKYKFLVYNTLQFLLLINILFQLKV